VVPVPDTRLDRLAEINKPQKVVPTTMEFVDIAGLVAGASKGEGLGNQFLAHIREVDAIAHVVRCFEDSDVVHVEGRVDPVADVEVINTELALADLESIERQLQRTEKVARVGDKEAQRRVTVLQTLRDALDQPGGLRTLSLSEEDRQVVDGLNLLTTKPVMYIANVDEAGLAAGNRYLEALQARIAGENAALVPVCASVEADLAGLDEAERREFLVELGATESGLARVIHAGYRLLGLLTFFTAGPKEVRAWTVPQGATAPEAAGRIHTDFQRGFIRAQVISYEDYIACNGEQGARDAGRQRVEGKEYRMREGDVTLFRFNV